MKSTISGQVWTWESWDSYHNGAPIVKANDPNFPALYYAGNFYKSSDLINKLNGKSLDAKINKPGVWYLPSCLDWREVVENLCFGDSKIFEYTNAVYWFGGKMLHDAFAAANGTSIIYDAYGADTYWTCSEYTLTRLFEIQLYSRRRAVVFLNTFKGSTNAVRPFVAF